VDAVVDLLPNSVGADGGKAGIQDATCGLMNRSKRYAQIG
jgi:hypothetical protein